MSGSQQLWAPLSISVNLSRPISSQFTLDHLDLFLQSSSIGGLSDQNTIASLVRLQAGLRDEIQSSTLVPSPRKERERSQVDSQGLPLGVEGAEEPQVKRKKPKKSKEGK